MFKRQATLVVALTAGILVTYGAMAMLSDANGPAHHPTPPQIDTFDLMSQAPVLPEQKIDNLF